MSFKKELEDLHTVVDRAMLLFAGTEEQEGLVEITEQLTKAAEDLADLDVAIQTSSATLTQEVNRANDTVAKALESTIKVVSQKLNEGYLENSVLERLKTAAQAVSTDAFVEMMRGAQKQASDELGKEISRAMLSSEMMATLTKKSSELIHATEVNADLATKIKNLRDENESLKKKLKIYKQGWFISLLKWAGSVAVTTFAVALGVAEVLRMLSTNSSYTFLTHIFGG